MSFPLAPPLKKVTNRQSKSFRTVLPDSQRPSSIVGGTSVAKTVTGILVFTFGMVSCSSCAFGSVHGVRPEGQANLAICVEFVPTGNVTFTVTGGATKFAGTANDELTETVQLKAVPKLAQAPPHPPNVVGAVGLAVSVTTVPLV